MRNGPEFSREYTLYAKCERKAGRTPKSPAGWLRKLGRVATAKQFLPARKPRRATRSSAKSAGPVKHIDPSSVDIVAPPIVDPEYLSYCQRARLQGRTPKPLHKWQYRSMKNRATAEKTSDAVLQHRFRPYKPPT